MRITNDAEEFKRRVTKFELAVIEREAVFDKTIRGEADSLALRLAQDVVNIAREELLDLSVTVDNQDHPVERLEVDGHTIDLTLGIYIEIGGSE